MSILFVPFLRKTERHSTLLKFQSIVFNKVLFINTRGFIMHAENGRNGEENY